MEAKIFLHSTAILVAAVACVTDLRSRRISNRLILIGLMSGMFFNLVFSGWSGLGWSFLGAALGLAIFLPFFALGGLGGGDVKLLSCLGAILGPKDLLAVALVGAVIGGAMALVVALARGRFLATVRGVGELLSFWVMGGLKPSPVLCLDNPGTLKIPYAVPVAAGTCLVLLSRWSWS
jgi:prepilin peptidase CpaA